MATHTRCILSRDLNAPHDFSGNSGWCNYGCGNRDDGRLIHPVSARELRPGPHYTHEQLAAMATTPAPDTSTPLWSDQ